MRGKLEVFIFLLLMVGCTTIPPGTSLGKPKLADHVLAKKAWLAKVEILDPSLTDKKEIVESSLTVAVQEFVREGKFFSDISLLPGRIGSEDVLLNLQFHRYTQKRSPHPAYFPAAILTLTLYIWFGGPIFVDTSDLYGTATIRNPSGEILAKATSETREEHNVSFWSMEYVFPSGLEARTASVGDLLGKVVREVALGKREGNS